MAIGKHRNDAMRSTKGQGIVEGAVGLWMIVLGAVVAVLLLVNSGMAALYKEKLGSVTNQAALYVANRATNTQSDQQVISDVKNNRVPALMQSMGLPAPQNVDVAISSTMVTVTVKTSGLKLIGNGTFLPTAIILEDTSSALIDDTKPKFQAVLAVCAKNQTTWTRMVIPCFYSYAVTGNGVRSTLLGPSSVPLPVGGGMVCYDGSGCVGDPQAPVFQTGAFSGNLAETWAPGTRL